MSYGSMTDAWDEIAASDLGNMGLIPEEERSEEAAHVAAEEISARKPTAAPAPVSTEVKRSRIRDALQELEPDELETSAQKAHREATTVKLDAAPVTRASGQVYHPRRLADKVDIRVLSDFREAGVPILLSGYPGCGKTSLVEAAYASDGGPVTIAGHGEMEMSEVIGRYVVRPGNIYEWVDGPLIVAMKEGRVLFIDDCTLIPTGVLARLYPVMDGRGVIAVDEHEGEVVTAKEGFYVIGAHNPGVPGAVLSEALASRFALHVDVPTDFQLAIELGIDRKIVKVAEKLTAMRDGDTKGSDIGWAPAMRELIAYQKIHNLLGEEAALRNIISICPELDRPALIHVLNAHVTVPKPLVLGGRL